MSVCVSLFESESVSASGTVSVSVKVRLRVELRVRVKVKDWIRVKGECELLGQSEAVSV